MDLEITFTGSEIVETHEFRKLPRLGEVLRYVQGGECTEYIVLTMSGFFIPQQGYVTKGIRVAPKDYFDKLK